MSKPSIHLSEMIQALFSLTLFRDLLDREPFVQASETETTRPEPTDEWLYRLIHGLTDLDEVWSSIELAGFANPFAAFLAHGALESNNSWTRNIERGEEPSQALIELARRDLLLIARAARSFADALAERDNPSLNRLIQPGWSAQSYSRPRPSSAARRKALEALAQLTAGSQNIDDAIDALRAYIQEAGAGPFNSSLAYRWTPQSTTRFTPVYDLDPVRLEDLVGYSRERQRVIENTERLVGGLPSQNLLLYGDRGTGKSATVKALAHRFGERRLRLVEVGKKDLPSLPDILTYLGERGLPFILFIDDLSFESSETEYKEVKASLEGSLARPNLNVKVYATSNRRHLLTERFSDRASSDDVRRQDTLQEQHSLSDRFGVTITFGTPTQKEYLQIVEGLARQYGVDRPKDILFQEALTWAVRHNGRSARTARQFVESLVDKAPN